MRGTTFAMDKFEVAQINFQYVSPSFNVGEIPLEVSNTCSRIWDPTQARFESCALPYISAIPAVLALCIVLGLISQLVLRGRLTPGWTRAFITEPEEEPEDPSVKQNRSFSRLEVLLFVTSFIGLGLQLATIVIPPFRLMMVYPAVPWAVECLLIVIYRPRTTPFYAFIILISIVASQLILLVDGSHHLTLDELPGILVVFTALVGIGIILLMPLRDPLRSKDGISPPFGPPTSELRSPEDNMTLWQFSTVSWMAPLISLGKTRQLNEEDVWELGYEFKHRLLHEKFKTLRGSVLSRLLQANGLDLVLIAVLGNIEVVANFSAPVLLQKLLQSMENPIAPKQAALKYAVLTLVVRLISAQADIFGLWVGRRAYERSRGEMITMLHEKSLSRKVVSISSKAIIDADLDDPKISNGNGNGVLKHGDRSKLETIYDFLMKPLRLLRSKKKSPKADSKEVASMGKIMNLMRFDAYEVAQRFWDFSYFINHPLSLVFSIVLIWKLLGWSCLFGIVTLILGQLINALIARALLHRERERRAATDTKLHKISQLVDSIRHLRYYGWQDVWLERIMESRKHELKLKVITAIWQMMITFTGFISWSMIPVVTFWAYTVLAGQPLRIDIAFPALQLFNMLESSLREIPGLITQVINTKISLGRLDEFMSEPDKEETDFTPSSNIEMKQASFAWPGATEPVLRDITIYFEAGLTVICGEVGAGKSALLQALLGELDQIDGEYHRTNEMVGYCGQTPWLQSMSIRDNILFSAPYEESRYKEVLEVCALVPDMASFKHGDLSLIGENGVGLSGGQKARVSLARAVYSKANILLLDDPLSALDHQTAEFIVRRCISGPLLKGRTTILVTHRTELCLGIAKQAIQVANGRAKIIDPDTIPFEELHRLKSSDTANEEINSSNENEESITAPDKFMEDEYRVHGGVKAAVYWEYIKAGRLKWWFILIIVLALCRTINVGETWFLKLWAEAYGVVEANSKGLFRDLPSPEKDVRPWLLGFFLLAMGQSLAYLLSLIVMVVIVYNAGKSLFQRVMAMVTHATFRFYDITPVGRLMNRLTSDINTADGNISDQFQQVAMLSITWISSIVVIASVTQRFLFFALTLTLGFVIIFMHFLPTSQSLRRLETVSLSPLISNFGELTAGLTTIRAYCAASRFQDRVISVTDKFQKMDHFYWSLQAWLMYRFDTLSAFSTFILTMMALYTNVSAGLTAFVLTAGGKFVLATHLLCRQYGQLQMEFVSVERVVELLHLEQEPPGKVQPPAYWPRYGGDIVFENVTIQYAPHLDPALSKISLTIKGGSTTALIGRTGSGKSTLALSLLATNLPVTGRILIDGIDISTIDLQSLRKRVTFLAQEPVLFPGTMRANLDPLDEYTDEECISVLHKIASNHQWSLNTNIDTGGRNISQGQRQLVGLARALLRRSPIVVMDEATASIDAETAGRIQGILREEMSESTVVVIAHRVEAVRGAEECVVLEKGRVVQAGEAGRMVGMMEEGS